MGLHVLGLQLLDAHRFLLSLDCFLTRQRPFSSKPLMNFLLSLDCFRLLPRRRPPARMAATFYYLLIASYTVLAPRSCGMCVSNVTFYYLLIASGFQYYPAGFLQILVFLLSLDCFASSRRGGSCSATWNFLLSLDCFGPKPGVNTPSWRTITSLNFLLSLDCFPRVGSICSNPASRSLSTIS
jgi:hypothetical protein